MLLRCHLTVLFWVQLPEPKAAAQQLAEPAAEAQGAGGGGVPGEGSSAASLTPDRAVEPENVWEIKAEWEPFRTPPRGWQAQAQGAPALSMWMPGRAAQEPALQGAPLSPHFLVGLCGL